MFGFTGRERSTRANASHAQTAVLIAGITRSEQDSNIVRLLDFFAIPYCSISLRESGADKLKAVTRDKPFSLIASAEAFFDLLSIHDEARWQEYFSGADCVYLYGFDGSDRTAEVLTAVSRDHNARLREVPAGASHLQLTANFVEMCGPMSGLEISGANAGEHVFEFSDGGERHESIISAASGSIFVRTTFRGLNCFLSTCVNVVNIHTTTNKYFDVKQAFSSAAPLTLFLKWAFRAVCWTNSTTNGCLILDDPLLKRRYGFFAYDEAIRLMDEHNFTTTIGFIPWNWRRTDTRVAGMLRERHDRISVCVHGCDHTGAEFAVVAPDTLNFLVQLASARMARFTRAASLAHEKIMVFPQGLFSAEALRALKLNQYVAAVNTEVAPVGDTANHPTIADLWDVAVMSYATFPLFTRRYIEHGIENFAFDAILGKPCLLVSHHQDFRDHGRALTEAVDKLNSLEWNLTWMGLGDVVRRGVKSRRRSDNVQCVQVFGTQAVVSNPGTEPSDWLVEKEESDANYIEAVTLDGRNVAWNADRGRLQLRITLPPLSSAMVNVSYVAPPEIRVNQHGAKHRLKATTRRILSELRDDYICRNDFVYNNLLRVMGFLR